MKDDNGTRWTKEQKKAIEIRDKNILVSAAAGSGKTAVLVERIKQLMVLDHIEIDEMLIVTFTNAAAAEMKQRLAQSLTNQIAMSETDNQFLRKQLNKLNSANISTFHGFCMEVIRRYFYFIDVEPNFRICDEIQKSLFQQEAIEAVIEESFENDMIKTTELMEAYGSVGSEETVKKMILSTYTFIQSLPEPFLWLKDKMDELKENEDDFLNGNVYMAIKEIIVAELEKAKDILLLVQDVISNEGLEKMESLAMRDIEAIEKLINTSKEEDFDALVDAASSLKFATFAASKEEKPSFEMIKESVKLLRDRAKKIVSHVKDSFLDGYLKDQVACSNACYDHGVFLCELVEQFRQQYEKRKMEKGVLDFNDIEHFALNILKNEEPANEYRSKFKHIFIDEYQDSNMVQETLVDRIKRDNNLFMVGDVKQSIYKFRLAEPDLFIRKYNDYRRAQKEESIKLDLNQNFRSKGSVISVINHVFEQVMTENSCGMAYDESAKLYQGVTYQGELDYQTELHVVDERKSEEAELDAEILEMKKAELEATVAAKLVKENIGKPIYSDKTGRIKNTTYRDIVILLRSYKNYAEIFSEIFGKEGIPIYTDSGDSYFDTIEISVFINLLKVIDNKKQDIALLSVLRSPIFGFSLDELSSIRLSSLKGAYYKAFEDYCICGMQTELKEKCQQVFDFFIEWKRKSEYMELSDFLYSLAMEVGYYDYIGALNYGKQRQANVQKLIDRAGSFQSTSLRGIFSFIHYVEQMKRVGVGPGQMQLLGENDDVVRLMSVHKSKGLEFPFVILGGMGKRFNRSKESSYLAFHKDLGIGLRMVNVQEGFYVKTMRQRAIDFLKLKEETAEEMRILYVAMTRAKDKLMLLGTVKKEVDELLFMGKSPSDADCFFDWALPAMLNKEGKGPWRVHRYDRKDMSIQNRKMQRNIKQIVEAFDSGFSLNLKTEEQVKLREKLEYIYPFQKATSIPSKFAVSELKNVDDLRDEEANRQEGNKRQQRIPDIVTALAITEDRKSFTAAEKGTIIHKMLQLTNLSLVKKYEDVVNQTHQWVEKEFFSPEEVAGVDLHIILNFATSEMGARLRKSERVLKEQAFTLVKKGIDVLPGLDDKETDVIIQGMVDCCFEEDGKWILLDYKTDSFPKNASMEMVRSKAKEYEQQLNLYKEALQLSTGKEVAESYLYFLGLGTYLKI